MLIDKSTGRQIIWGFLLENTYFTEFDESNHAIIEKAYSQRKKKQTSHYIVIRDSHLASPARIYFGVVQVHLRMPGTRYYVRRNLSKFPMAPSPTVTSEPCFHQDLMLSDDPSATYNLVHNSDHQSCNNQADITNFHPFVANDLTYSFTDPLISNNDYYSYDFGQSNTLYNVLENTNDHRQWSTLTDPMLWLISQEMYSYTSLNTSVNNGSFYSIL
ncbi:hypothetical protein G6F57_001067 [Rhizopus arrhizus]|uniref:Uncharacterized protein n=1 Tax=Rhizopus oryzae TaxID=64495 RepID=A0A9P7BWW8_RHIOR|nr:hypothetical protein G6F23_007189 [Rhizopus arrhizus]KAG1416628.1 hypothetical protein G6F58_005895 [Rhizopus delemar]KAG0766416.1 hypothetical protein G6F24_003631 [Rhizopus arrhizus]KAG0784063.1 hypothetical protein G6F21_010148 [Rhizopus arrhizus]KAG0798115.1 hypothetical protein G6F22_004542 [Rhizopus arrhizus]